MSSSVIETKQGKVAGTILAVKPELSDKKCVHFQAIPFGKYERFERPTAHGKWEGTLDGTGVTPRQHQHNAMLDHFDAALGICLFPDNSIEFAAKAKYAKDTLHLSVTTPENFTESKKKPVMVWIHGGGWTLGGAYEYSPPQLCVAGDVVIVCISYRLGVLGFGFGNFALWDQLEALKWVQENISDYGGDKDNVTIFGESAGGWSVEALLSSEKTVGYFHKAIAQSGCLRTMFLENDGLHGACMAFGKKYFDVESDLEFKECLRKCNDEDTLAFMKAVPQAIGSGFTARTETDDFFSQKFKDQDTFPNKVPFLTGMNSTESGCLFLVMGEYMAPGLMAGWTYDQMLEMYKKGSESMGGDPEDASCFIEAIKKVYSAGRDMSGKMEWSRLHALHTGDSIFMGMFDRTETICEEQPVYNYQLNVRTKAFHEEPYKNGNEKVRQDFCRADHADDLMYMWGLMFCTDYQMGQGRYFSEEEKDLSRRMMKVWSDFARTGNPGWNSFDKETRIYKEFNTPCDEIKSSSDPELHAKIAVWKGINNAHKLKK